MHTHMLLHRINIKQWFVSAHTQTYTLRTWGSVPVTKCGMSSEPYPSSLRPLTTPISCMYVLKMSLKITPASSFLPLLMSAPIIRTKYWKWSMHACYISVPSMPAASRCLSGHMLAVKVNTAGALITTDKPWGCEQVKGLKSQTTITGSPPHNQWFLWIVISVRERAHIGGYGIGETMTKATKEQSSRDHYYDANFTINEHQRFQIPLQHRCWLGA